ncbi:Esterase/lipase superfamily enzyme [Fodinibius salinus]|uniref:Esterase/lipase superfamily enzyme n=1 Tax=Fodinibius salinus TaxID=860790 RepID=A0A5D3YSA7_9BACT|nr:alpha/beta hydrolase-fold protein [Fodinibius salinus]TYP95441.1 Esterase/lipase superfamily enzyme [Fodinibius salinus]
MNKETTEWRSPSLGKDMKLTTYGTSGTPLIALPTREADSSQWEEYGMVDAISYQLENGFNQLFCLSSVDGESFCNSNTSPKQRLVRHQQYESYLVEEVVPYVKEQSNINYIIIAGTDFGGYHAVSIALKHPKLFGKAIGMSGIYDITPWMDDFYDDNVYYNNPTDFIPNLNQQSTLDNIRDVDFRLVSYENDDRKHYADRMSDVLRMKYIEHDLDIWDLEGDEWELWSNMLKTHII